MRREALVSAIAAGIFAALAACAPAFANDPQPNPFVNCPAYGDTRICSGSVPSFDLAPLDFDLTEPSSESGPGPHPLVIMLHGLGGNKHDWESTTDEGDGADKWHWNSHWFSKHGYYVLTYTARGHLDNGPSHPQTQPPTPSFSSFSSPNGTAHLKSRDFEIKDTQWLAALAAAARPDLDTSRVAVTGGSYGGGESWLQASQPTWTFPVRCVDPASAPPECRDSNGNPNGAPSFEPPLARPVKALELQVAVPKYPWTDMGYSLAPNGHPGPWPSDAPCDESSADDPCYASATQSAEKNPDPTDGSDACPPSQGPPEPSSTRACNPLGVLKESYVQALADTSQSTVTFECLTTVTPSEEFPAGSAAAVPPHCIMPKPPDAPEPVSWYQRSRVVGDPYDDAGAEDPLVQQVRRGTTEFRSSYYQDREWKKQVAGREVAIFSIQGWTDDLFPALESFRQFKYLKKLDARWPVALAIADVGHSRGQNKPATWHRLNDQAWQFAQSQIGGSHGQQTTVYSEPTTCVNDGDPANNVLASMRLTATTPEGLSNGRLTVTYQAGGTSSPGRAANPADDPDNLTTEPIAGFLVEPGEHCRSSRAGAAPRRYTGVSQPLPSALTYIGLGTVKVHYHLLPADGAPAPTTATLEARLWDVPPGAPPLGCLPDQAQSAPGCPLLVTRGAYRIDVPAYDTGDGTIHLPLFGNEWPLQPGHRLRLDLTQTDNPTWLPSNQPSALTFDPPKLFLPIRESRELSLGCDGC
jgi:pimeloyl-ACP methyl ester carboxylesterase